MTLYIRNQGNVLLEYVLQAEMLLTVKTKFSSLLRAWTHLEYSFIQNNLSQIGGKFEFRGDVKWGLSHTNAQQEQKEMVLYETQQNRAVGRRRMQILQREYKRKTFCVISVANKNNNNRDINAANKKGLKKM